MPNVNKEIVKSSVLVSLITGCSLIIGFVSQILIAYYFGTSRQLDRFFIAYAFPSLFIGISRAAFSSSLIPTFTPIRNSPETLKTAVSTTLFYSLTISAFVMFFGFLARRFILQATTNLSPDDSDLTVSLAGLVWLIAGLGVLINFVSSLHQFSKYFTLPAVVFLLPTTGRIIGTVLLARQFGIQGLILGELVFCLLSLLVLLPIIFKYKPHPRQIQLGNLHALRFLKAVIPVSISLVPFTVLPSIDAFWASKLSAGSMSYIGYSTRIVIALGSLVMNGIYMVIFPYLSEDIANNRTQAFLSRVGTSIKGISILFIPVALFCTFYRYELTEALFKRGMFTSASVKGVASVLPFYLAGLVAMGPTTLISRAYFARKEFSKFGALSLFFITMYFVLAGFLSNHFSYMGIGVAYMVYWFLFFITSTLLLEKRILSADFLSHCLKLGLCAFGSVAVSYLAINRLVSSMVLVNLVLGFVGTCLLFILFCHILKITQAISVTTYVYNLAAGWVVRLSSIH